MADIPQVVSTEPAQRVPGLMDLASSDPVAIAYRGLQQAEANLPTPEERDKAARAYDVAIDKFRKDQAEYPVVLDTMQKKWDADVQAYAEKAKQNRPQQQPIQQPPSRGLQPYLSSTQGEPVEATIGKFLQTMSLFATMAGGGKTGARASLSAYKGMLEGWREGNTAKADRDYQTWKDSTKAMLDQFDNEMRAYNSLLTAERVPLEQRHAAIQLKAYEMRNALLGDEIDINNAVATQAALQKRYDAREEAMEAFTKVIATKVAGDQTRELARQRQEENLNARLMGLDLQRQRNEIMRLGVEGEGLDAATLERLADERMNGAPWTELIRGWGPRAQAKQDAIDKRVDQKIAEAGSDPATARLVRQRMLQADTKSAESLARQQAQWSAFEKAFPPAVENMIRIAKKIDGRTGMPIVDKWLLKARMEYSGDEDVKALDQAMDVVAMEYARVVKRQGISDVATQNRAKAMFNLGATPEQFRRVVDEALMPDIQYARQGFDSAKQGIISSMKAGQKALTAPPPEATPAKPSGETVSRTNAAYQRARKSGMSDQEIEQKYGVRITD